MDFEKLGEALINDSVEDNDNYVKVGTEESQPAGKFDFEKAKAFLSTTNQRLNISLYDHMADVIKAILRSKIPEAADKFEDISHEVKKLRQKPESDLTEVLTIPEELQAFIEEKKIFYKFKQPVPEADEVIRTIDDDEDEEESDEEEAAAGVGSSESVEEHDLSVALPDIYYIMSRFNEAGIGLSPVEVFELSVALKDLATEFKLKKVRFWGKMFGIKNDYYVAEAPYQEGIVQENYGWKSAKKSKTELEEATEEKEKDEDEEDEEDDKVEEEKEEEKEDEEEEGEEKEEAVKIPPIPEPKQETKKKIPSEKNGTGVNEYVYFVCTKLGQPWRVLPFMLPSHISEARYLKRFFTGDLELQIKGCVPYPGKEAHYLRAQIARITATSYISPKGFYKSAGEKDEDDEEEEEEEDEEKDANEVVLNSQFEPKRVKNLLLEGFAEWCHYRKAILYQGRCIPMKIGEKDEDEDEEETEEPEDKDEDEDEETEEKEEPEILEAIAETQVPVLRSLSEDKAIGRLKPWRMRLSSKLMEEKSILIVYCNIWPGAYTFYDGKNFEHIYIGYGMKFSVFHHAPAIRVHLQPEYEVGEDLIEDVNEEILPKEETEEGDEGDEKEKEEEEDEEDEKDEEDEEDDDD